MSEGERFLSETELDSLSKKWQAASHANEDGINGYIYPVARFEGNPKFGQNIEGWHRESFIKFIQGLIDANSTKPEPDKSRKIKVLDLGGGAGIYADQIRKAFGDRVKVYTTGLSKREAKQWRKEELKKDNGKRNVPWEVSKRLHKDDLKWRSISQLTNYPEFDLIIDTHGENTWGSVKGERMVEMIAAKLRPGGMASIAVFPKLETSFKEELEKKYGVVIKKAHRAESILKIYKQEK